MKASTAAEAAPVVFLVDDEEDVTRGLVWLLDSVSVKSRSFNSPLRLLQEPTLPDQPACLVTDLRMPEMSGVELVQELLARGLSMPVVFLTAHGDVPTAVKAMQLGAVDFVQKPFNPDAFLGSIGKALKIARENDARRRAQQDVETRLKLLSPREREVFDCLLRGLSSKQIGRAFDISFKTVDVHRANLMHKLEVGSYVELVRRFARADNDSMS
jgi:two-component system, LuxR family, response regulator FixJ